MIKIKKIKPALKIIIFPHILGQKDGEEKKTRIEN
jgi:hypothetical protein